MYTNSSAKRYLLVGTLFFFSLLFPFSASATTTTCPTIGSTISITSDCDLPLATDGFDGPVTINTGGVFRIGNSVSNQTVYLPKITLNGGSIITNAVGSKIVISSTLTGWMLDADSDKWPSTTEKRFQASAPTASWKRANTMISTTTVDCYDSNAAARPNNGTTPTPAFQTAARGDTSFDYNCDGSQTQQYSTTTAYSCVASSCAAHYYVHTDGWATAGAPACGVAKNWSSFATNGSCAADTGCAGQTTVSRTQGCR